MDIFIEILQLNCYAVPELPPSRNPLHNCIILVDLFTRFRKTQRPLTTTVDLERLIAFLSNCGITAHTVSARSYRQIRLTSIKILSQYRNKCYFERDKSCS